MLLYVPVATHEYSPNQKRRGHRQHRHQKDNTSFLLITQITIFDSI